MIVIILQVWGSVGEMNASVVAQLGCIAQGFSNEQLATTAFSLNSLEDIAPCGWNNSQVMLDSYLERFPFIPNAMILTH